MLRTVAPLGGSCPCAVTSSSPAQLSITPPTSFPPSFILGGLHCSGQELAQEQKVERAVETQQLGPTKGWFRALRLGGPHDSIFSAVAQVGDGSSLTHGSPPHAPDAHSAHPTNPAPGPQLCWVPWLGGEAKVRKGSGSSAGNSKHKELKRTMKTAAGTVQFVSPARKSTGLVQRQGQDRRKPLGPCTPIPPCHVPYVRRVEMETFQMETGSPIIHLFLMYQWGASCAPSSGPCGQVTQELPCPPPPYTGTQREQARAAPSAHPGSSRKQLPPHKSVCLGWQTFRELGESQHP